MEVFTDAYFMREALKLARRAMEEGEVPVGAVVVSGKRIIAKGYNQTELLKDSTAHAEMIALTAAMDALGAKYLKDCTLYVSLEPCLMCAGALRWSQIGRVVYAAADPHKGYARVEQLIPPGQETVLHPKTVVDRGLMATEAKALVDEFFDKLRTKKNVVAFLGQLPRFNPPTGLACGLVHAQYMFNHKNH
ncbi:MAG: nucleoside deaminase [Cytophagales bacterium]|nr:nucleoside deaminase [Cytophagales bacterium]